MGSSLQGWRLLYRGGVESDSLIREYLLLGLRFDRIESGYVDAFTGDPGLRRAVENEPEPLPSDLARRADGLLGEITASLKSCSADFIAAHLRPLACAGRKFTSQPAPIVTVLPASFVIYTAQGDIDP